MCAGAPPATFGLAFGRRPDARAFGVDFVEPGGKSLGQSPRVGEHDRRVVRFDQVDQSRLDIGPDAVVLQVGHVGHRHLHGQLDSLGRRRGHDGRRGLRRTRTGRAPRADARLPTTRCAARAAATHARRAARATGPGGRRACRRRWRASRRRSPSARRPGFRRAADVSIRNSDSGVVISTSGGRAMSCRRCAAGVSPERTPTLISGGGQPVALSDPGKSRQRGAQVALDVDRQRLERGDVEHTGAGFPVRCRCKLARLSIAHRNAASVLPEPVGAITRVLSPSAIAVPGLRLRGGRRGESAREPLAGDGAEPAQGSDGGESGRALT